MAAQKEPLPNRRAIYEHAAALCDEMAGRIEEQLQFAEERAAAKAEREGYARARERRRRVVELSPPLADDNGRPPMRQRHNIRACEAHR